MATGAGAQWEQRACPWGGEATPLWGTVWGGAVYEGLPARDWVTESLATCGGQREGRAHKGTAFPTIR